MRRLQPTIARHLWSAIRTLSSPETGAVEHSKMVKFLEKVRQFSADRINEFISLALAEKLIQCHRISDTGEPEYRLPAEEPLADPENTHDWYCFECHQPYDENKPLEPCRNCVRVFHRVCNEQSDEEHRREYEAFNYHKDAVPSERRQSDSFPEQQQQPQPQNGDESATTQADRPETNGGGQEARDLSLCYPCRILQKAQLDTRPPVSAEELNYLLRFVLDRVQGWLEPETYSLLAHSKRLSYVVQNLKLSRARLVFNHVTLEAMEQKIATQSFRLFEEFQVDCMDIAHNLALIFGPSSDESDAGKYLRFDATFEVTEIKSCPDCYRHSNEKFDPMWFAWPCASRTHELVWAKQAGWPFWPAKVIKRSGRLYDVRFFGAEHSRAVIDQRSIRPIEEAPVKNSGSKTLQAAIKEMREHQRLLTEPTEKFTFEGERTIRERILASKTPQKRRQRRYIYEGRKSSGTSKRKSDSSNRKSMATVEKRSESDSEAKVSKPSTPMSEMLPQAKVCLERIDLKPNPLKRDADLVVELHNGGNGDAQAPAERAATGLPPGIRSRLTPEQYNSVQRLKRKLDGAEANADVKRIALDHLIKHFEEDQERLVQLQQEHEKAIYNNKLVSWCYTCQKEAIYHCCWNTNYCSRGCQTIHWGKEHKASCRRLKNLDASPKAV